jgi:pseudouridine-5'-phosphate glycosidase
MATADTRAVARRSATGIKIDVRPEVASALAARRPVVALESTVIAHGLPRPMNLETALAMESDVRGAGATPATIAIADGAAVVGAEAALLTRLANDADVAKVSLRDLAPILARRGLGATTVASTVEIAARAGIAVMATGGIGGVHRGAQRSFDESADLEAIARNAVCVVCAGAKLILDLELTLERLETLGVPVIGYGTDELPAFYVRSSGLRLPYRVDNALAAARIAREQLARGAGLVIAVPVAAGDALDRQEAEAEVARAIDAADAAGIRGAALTPYLLGAVGEATSGRSLRANISLLRQNARVAALIALALAT